MKNKINTTTDLEIDLIVQIDHRDGGMVPRMAQPISPIWDITGMVVMEEAEVIAEVATGEEEEGVVVGAKDK